MEREQNDDPGTCIPVTASTAVSQARRLLLAFLTEHTATLLGSFRSYVQRMGLAQGQAIPAVALDVLQEAAVEALAHVDRFDPERQPMAWLLGIGMNVIRRKVEANEQASLILALVSPADQHILRLAILLDCERETLARELGITPVAARVRLHRALNRLRVAWQEAQRQQQQAEHAEAGERKPL